MFSYIHIPFCDSKCDYCRFASYAGLDSLKVKFYVDFLLREIQLSTPGKQTLKSVYFGGGTPTTLLPEQLGLILRGLEKKFGFEKNIEISLESTPEKITKENIVAWKKLGINRISMGIQSLNNKALAEVGRKGTSEIYRALGVLEKSDIENISIDFIIGLPFVKRGELKTYIEYIVKHYTKIQNISVYMLEDYYEKPREIDSKFQNVTYPVSWSKDGLKEEEFLDEYQEIRSYLQTAGYTAYEISNFAKKGYECRHNKAYWNHSDVLAFGLGASGFLKNTGLVSFLAGENEHGTRYKNSENFGEYYRGENREEERLSEEDMILEKIMFGLRTDGFSMELLDSINRKKYEECKVNGLLKEKNGKVVLGKKGYTLLDSIIMELI